MNPKLPPHLTPDSLAARPLIGRARRLRSAEWHTDRTGQVQPESIMLAAALIARHGLDSAPLSLVTTPEGGYAHGARHIPPDLVDQCGHTDEAAQDHADACCDIVAGYAGLRAADPENGALARYAESEHGTGRTLPEAPSRVGPLAQWLAAGIRATQDSEQHDGRSMAPAVLALRELARAKLARQWLAEADALRSEIDAVARAVLALAAQPTAVLDEIDRREESGDYAYALHTAREIVGQHSNYDRANMAARAPAIAATIIDQCEPSPTSPANLPRGARDLAVAAQRANDAAEIAARERREAREQVERLTRMEAEARAEAQQHRDRATLETGTAKARAAKAARDAEERAAAAARQLERERDRERTAAATEADALRERAEARETAASEPAQTPTQSQHCVRYEGGRASDPIGAAVAMGCAECRSGEPISASSSLPVEVIQ
jgi:hypothetical protein